MDARVKICLATICLLSLVGIYLCDSLRKELESKRCNPMSGIYFAKKYVIDFDFNRPESEWFKVSQNPGSIIITNMHIEGGIYTNPKTINVIKRFNQK